MYTLIDLGSSIYMANPEMMEEAKELSKKVSYALFWFFANAYIFIPKTCHDNILKHLVKS